MAQSGADKARLFLELLAFWRHVNFELSCASGWRAGFQPLLAQLRRRGFGCFSGSFRYTGPADASKPSFHGEGFHADACQAKTLP
jgi:hypothetical protein